MCVSVYACICMSVGMCVVCVHMYSVCAMCLHMYVCMCVCPCVEEHMAVQTGKIVLTANDQCLMYLKASTFGLV